MVNKVVIHFLDKKIRKGHTFDFAPDKDMLHVMPDDPGDEKKTIEVNLNSLKAVFFVKDFIGNKDYKETQTPEFKVVGAKKIKVEFTDGEIMVGSTIAYNPGRKGIFITPSDPKANNIRVYAPFKSLKTVELLI
jgi:hypothetical protein